MKKVLLVGSSFSAAPILFVLKKRGYHVSVCGKHKTDPCHQYADQSFFIDYSNRNDLLDVASSEPFDYLVPTCNDYSYMSSAWVAEALNFPGFDSFNTATILHTKDKFRQLSERGLFPAPKSRRVNAFDPKLSKDLTFPLLAKPVDSFSGRGVTKIHDESGMMDAIDCAVRCSRTGEAVLEEFVEGELHSHSAFIRDKEVVLDFFVDEYCTVYPYQVDCSNHPSLLPESLKNTVRESINLLAEDQELCDGLLHTQFIASGGNFWIIECMRRCPGDLYGNLIERSSSANYTDLFARPFVQDTYDSLKIRDELLYCGRHTVSTSGSLTSYTFGHSIPSITTQIVPLKTSGERLDAAPYDKLAILFSVFENEATMKEITPNLAEFVEIQSLEGTYL